MQSITPISNENAADKDRWVAIGCKILAFHHCGETAAEIGRCIDLWKKTKSVPEEEMIDGLGFFLGEVALAQHGGIWVWVVDEFGQTPAIQRKPSGYVSYVLDWVSKRLRDSSVAEREIPSVVAIYAEIS